MGEAPFARLEADLRDLLTQVTSELQGGGAHRAARRLAAARQEFDADRLSDALREWLGQLVVLVVDAGWAPGDLREIVARRGDRRMLPMLAALLTAETERHPDERVDTRWRVDLNQLPTPIPPDFGSIRDLETLLGLAAVLLRLPTIERTMPAPGSAPMRAGSADVARSSKHLTRVRALLAKAESTDSADEAEALSAKAQELISRYALERLLHEPTDDAGDVSVRRVWIDSPYVRAKATLVHEIAKANRCRAVFTERLEFMTVVGEQTDLDAVELMTASLLVQAQTAMLAHGSRSDGWGTSRTRSFRRSFLIAYAGRIGERLRSATDSAAEETGQANALVPVLQRRAEQVDAALAEMFPRLGKSRRTSISNGDGYAAGRAAADRASLDAHKRVTAAPSR